MPEYDQAMADWVTISALATAGGTLVLAVATYGSVRSANRSARTAEVALREQRRPVIVPSRLDDPLQKIMFGDRRWVHAEGGRGAIEHDDGIVYMALSLRNVGAGIGILHGWHVLADVGTSREHAPLADFRPQQRDLLIPPGDIGLWQGALRDPEHDWHAVTVARVEDRDLFSIELLYSDQVGEQRSISRFSIAPASDGETWMVSLTRHWDLEDDPPRRSR